METQRHFAGTGKAELARAGARCSTPRRACSVLYISPHSPDQQSLQTAPSLAGQFQTMHASRNDTSAAQLQMAVPLKPALCTLLLLDGGLSRAGPP